MNPEPLAGVAPDDRLDGPVVGRGVQHQIFLGISRGKKGNPFSENDDVPSLFPDHEHGNHRNSGTHGDITEAFAGTGGFAEKIHSINVQFPSDQAMSAKPKKKIRKSRR